MKLHKLALLGLPLVLFGCPTEDDTDTIDTDDTDIVDTDDTDIVDTDPPPALEVTVTLNDNPDTMVIVITNGTESYNFGYAQTAVIDAGGDGWTGEDCHNGYATYNLCHDVGTAGATLTNVATPQEVVAGSTMLLSVDTPASATPALTYILIGATSGDCWVWGDDITYYDDYSTGSAAAPLCAEYTAPM